MCRLVPEVNLDLPRTSVNLRDPPGLESHFGSGKHKWLYCIALKITETLKTYHNDNVGTKSAGNICLPHSHTGLSYYLPDLLSPTDSAPVLHRHLMRIIRTFDKSD